MIRELGDLQDLDNSNESQARARLAAIVESSNDAIISKDFQLRITSWNRAAERIYGYRAQEVMGRQISILVPPGQEDEAVKILERIKNGEQVDHFETRRRRKDGTIIDVSLTVSPIRQASGNIVGGSIIARDISDRKRTELELKQA